MTNDEFSVQFDVLYNNITSNQAPGLNDYEKSVFLTKAQYQILEEYFNPVQDTSNGGFDRSRRRQIDFSNLIKVEEYEEDGSDDDNDLGDDFKKINNDSLCFIMEGDVFFILNESLLIYEKETDEVTDKVIASYPIIPLSCDEYNRLLYKPYKYPPKGIVWRLINTSEGRFVAELIGRNYVEGKKVYSVRYITRPSPIIVGTLPEGLTIEGDTTATESPLPRELHQNILERAVTLAKIAWSNATMTQTALAVQSGK